MIDSPTENEFSEAKEQQQLIDECTADVMALNRESETIQLSLTHFEGWVLMSQLQLALRHPQNGGVPAGIARDLATKLLTAVATTPALRKIAVMGWEGTVA